MIQGIHLRVAHTDLAADFRAAWRRRMDQVNPAEFSRGSGGDGFTRSQPVLPEDDAELRAAALAREIEELQDPERWDGMA